MNKDPRLPVNQRDRAGSAVRRGRNNCRLVVTLEIEVPQQVLKHQPSHLRDAITYMRKLLERKPLDGIFGVIMHEHLLGSGATVLDTKVEVAG